MKAALQMWLDAVNHCAGESCTQLCCLWLANASVVLGKFTKAFGKYRFRFLFRLHMAGVLASEGDSGDLKKKWWSPLRLQVASASRAVARGLGEENTLALKLQQLASDILSQTQ